MSKSIDVNKIKEVLIRIRIIPIHTLQIYWGFIGWRGSEFQNMGGGEQTKLIKKYFSKVSIISLVKKCS